MMKSLMKVGVLLIMIVSIAGCNRGTLIGAAGGAGIAALAGGSTGAVVASGAVGAAVGTMVGR